MGLSTSTPSTAVRKVANAVYSLHHSLLMCSLDKLPKELKEELEKLQVDFIVDTKRLKQISKRFIEELEEGKRHVFIAPIA